MTRYTVFNRLVFTEMTSTTYIVATWYLRYEALTIQPIKCPWTLAFAPSGVSWLFWPRTMSSRYSNVEKHSGHDEDQCGVRRSARSESAMALKHSRDCCAPYHQPKARRHRHQILSSNSLIASSPSSCSESAWLHYNCRRSSECRRWSIIPSALILNFHIGAS